MINRLFGLEQLDRLFDQLRIDPARGLALLDGHSVDRCPDVLFRRLRACEILAIALAAASLGLARIWLGKVLGHSGIWREIYAVRIF